MNLKTKGHSFRYKGTANMLGTIISYYQCNKCNVIVEMDDYSGGCWRLGPKLLMDKPFNTLPSCTEVIMEEALGEDL